MGKISVRNMNKLMLHSIKNHLKNSYKKIDNLKHGRRKRKLCTPN